MDMGKGDANLFCCRQSACFLHEWQAKGSGVLIWITGNNLNDKTRLEREIEATDRQIDGLVYRLYGLAEEEMKLVESLT